MYKIDLPVDNSVAEAVERRRAAEAARQNRIFNTKHRVMGVDLRALERQVAERREREEMEKQRDIAHDLLRVSLDDALVGQQQEEEERRTELGRDLIQYRATDQRAADSRDADLNFNRQGAPGISFSIPESELGPASMQVFQGEDAGRDERKRVQMEKNEKTLRAQRNESERLRQEHKHQELLNDRALVQQDLRGVQLDALEEECKRAARFAFSSFNQAQAEERTERLKKERQRKDGEELAEVWHTVTSDILTECPEAAEGLGPRVLTDRWRGMSGEQLGAIRRQREEQRAERERERATERQKELAWDFQRMEQAREQEAEEKRARELERERRIQLDRHNQQLAREQHAHQQYLDKQLYTNLPSAQYFTQFSSSSR